MRSSKRRSERSDVPPFHVMQVMQAAADREAAGLEVLHLEVGQPSTAAPTKVIEAAIAALTDDVLGYTTALGIEPLRQRISQWYLERHGTTVDPANVVITTGASGSCVLAFLALFNPGDRVAVLEPGYPCYRNDLTTFGVEAVPVPVGPETGFRPTVSSLEAVGRLDGLVLASPSNPTGTIIPPAELEELLGWAADNDVHVVVDEIYQGIEYGTDRATSATAWIERTGATNCTIFNSFSKYWSMTGWRLGWIVAPSYLVTPLERLAQNLTIAPPTISQLAGVAAFDAVAACEERVAAYAVNRDILLDGLRAAGLPETAPPDGAFYVWVDISRFLDEHLPNSQALCARWLDELGVAATPGIDFDPVRGDRFVRFSYARDEATVREAMWRLGQWASARSA